MKTLIYTSLLIFNTTLSAMSLEDSLVSSNIGELEEKKSYQEEYFEIKFSDIIQKDSFDIQGYTTGEGEATAKALGIMQDLENRASYHNIQKDNIVIESKYNPANKNNINESKAYQYFKSIKTVGRTSINIYYVVSFSLDKKRKITDLEYMAKTEYTPLDNMITNAIYDARFDFIKKKEGLERITLKFKFVN